ncbi:MAG: SDR family oxidoreductase [Opitutus sp.]|nr:SDR family oxidoreductase [Opitutus sp.]
MVEQARAFVHAGRQGTIRKDRRRVRPGLAGDAGGAKGVLHASQIGVGEENNLNLRIYGTKAAHEWHQEHPNELADGIAGMALFLASDAASFVTGASYLVDGGTVNLRGPGSLLYEINSIGPEGRERPGGRIVLMICDARMRPPT